MFYDKLESVRYKAGFAITGAMQCTSKEKLFMKLGLESLKSRRWLNNGYAVCLK